MKKNTIWVVIGAITSVVTSVAVAEEPVPIGLQKQLLVDDYVIAEARNVTRELGKVTKHGVVMKPSVPTDFHPTKQFPDGLPATGSPGFGYRIAVLWDKPHQKFQMWYRACGEKWTGYAESKDGIRWTRPLISGDGKSNLITYRGRSGGAFYEATCMVDPTVRWGHPEKYKAAFNPGNTRCAIAYSADGIHWQGYNKGQSATGRAADTQNQILWDPIARRYMLLTRTDIGTRGGKTEDRATRIMVHNKGNDLMKHPTAWKTVATVRVDDPKRKKTPAGVMELQMEAMNIWAYENVYFGLMHVLRLGDVTGSGHAATKLDLQARHETDVIDTYIGTSRDGIHFDRHWVHAKRPLVPRGPDGSFDKDMLHAASEIITHKDRHWIYYSGFDHRHHSSGGGGKIGLAKLRLDGFICLAAKDKPAAVVTKPFKLEGARLEVNVDAKAGWVQVELLDETGKAIPEFSGKAAKTYRGLDNLRLAPKWKGQADLSPLKGKEVRLRFTMENAKLYAFQVTPGRAGQTLYNGIELPDQWPPKLKELTRDPIPLPYLKNPPKIIPIDVGRQLFVDDFLIEETTLKRSFHSARYHEINPVVKPDKPWESGGKSNLAIAYLGGVWYDPADSLFKMWYQGGNTGYKTYGVCYATSKDGIHWDKPILNVAKGGTNFVIHGPRNDCCTVWLDHDAKTPAERFKIFNVAIAGKNPNWHFIYRASPDGVHWSKPLASRRTWGDFYTAFYNPFRRVWVVGSRIHDYSRRHKVGRCRGYLEDADPRKLVERVTYDPAMTLKGDTVYWVGADRLDPRNPDPRFKGIRPELYSLSCAPYESLMLGLFAIWTGPSNRHVHKEGGQKRNDILVGFSRDGFHWDRPCRDRFISSSWKKGTWNFGNVQPVGGGCLVVGDKLYFYVSARADDPSGEHGQGTTGVAVLRRDGFASMDADGKARTMTTRPVTFKGKHLFVNVDCPKGELKAEVLDADGKAIEPFTLENCKPISCDKTLAGVTWKQAVDLSAVSGKPVRFRFQLTNGSLYAFWVSPAKSGASHGYVGAGGPGFTGPTDTVGQGASIAAAETPVGVGLQKQLFVDDYVIAKKENVTLEVGQARKYGVVMKPTLPTDFQSGNVHDGPDGGFGFESPFCWFFSPHWDPNKKMFRLWYMAGKRHGSGLAYAESKDGIHWKKPMVAKDGKTNLVLAFGLDGVTVTIDPNVPYGAPDKFKCAYFPIKGPCQTRLGYSADGIRWKFYNNAKPVTGRAADFSNQILWDPIRKRYLLLCRQDFAGAGGIGELRGVRIMEHSKGNDLVNHPTAWKTLTTFLLKDPDKALIPGTNTPVYQIHTFPMWYYEGVWFGLTDILAATNKHLKKGTQDYQTRHDRGVWEFYMAPSRDGIKYDFSVAAYPRKPLIPRGPAGSFDKDCVRPPTNIITHNDEHWIYYLATNERWGCHKWDARLALAKLRLDGFFYLEAKEKPGTVVTKPFKLEGGRLLVNVDAAKGKLIVEVLDAKGKPVPGFSAGQARAYEGADDLRLAPLWKAGRDLAALRGKVIRLKFHLRNAKLYSFRVASQLRVASPEPPGKLNER